jgi:hypothetical protein
MPITTYRPSRAQQIYFRVLLGIGIAFLIPVPLAVVHGGLGLIAGAILFSAVLSSVFILVSLHHMAAKTELTESGISTSHLISHRACRWEDITGLTAKISPDSKTSDVTIAIIKLRDGGDIKLATPRTWSPFPRDRQFDEKIAAIQATFRDHTSHHDTV